MKRHWTNEELAEHWILSSKELDLIGDSKTDHNLLGAACLLKYFQQEGRFPAQKQDIPPIVIVHLAKPLGVIPEKIIPYDWEGRTIKAHRAAIRTFLGGNFATLADEEALVEWLCQEVVAEQRQEEALIASLYTRCKEQRIDPPTPDRVRFTLLAAYCWRRRQEIVAILVELLLDVAHHLTTRAERRVEKAFVKDIKCERTWIGR